MLLFTQFILFESTKKINQVGEKFGFEVSHLLSAITKLTVGKPTCSRSYAHHSELVSVI